MVLIIGIAGAAMAALAAYNKAKNRDPEGAKATVTHLRQSTSVVLAIGTAIHAVLDALQLITRATNGLRQPGAGLSIGTRVHDVEDAGT